jgi:dTDP-4-dehydrorhamnose reductase
VDATLRQEAPYGRERVASILVTGAYGMVGSDLCRLLARNHRVYSTGRGEMDVADAASVVDTVERLRPDLVVHAAALTDVDYCQLAPEDAFRINARGTQNVALACQRVGATMVYISTIAVFDGTKPTAYTEADTPNPQSVYAQSKFQGEQYVESLLTRYYIVRAGWVFGGGANDKKFVGKMLSLARERDVLKVVDDNFGSPTYTLDISQGITALTKSQRYGTYHMVNAGAPASRFEIAERILEFGGITSCQLVPVSAAEFPLPAPRPRMEAAVNCRLTDQDIFVMRPWHEALREYVQGTLCGKLQPAHAVARA